MFEELLAQLKENGITLKEVLEFNWSEIEWVPDDFEKEIMKDLEYRR